MLSGGAIYEDDQFYIRHILDVQEPDKAYLGYLMIEPKRHVSGLAELTDAEAQAIGLQVSRAFVVTKLSCATCLKRQELIRTYRARGVMKRGQAQCKYR